MKTAFIGSILLCALGVSGCNFNARGPEKYRDDTRAVLDTRAPQIKACYDALLKEDKTATGTVVITLSIKPETGEFTDIKVKDKGSSESEPLRKCVTDALTGLKLDPPDQRQGNGTFTYEFKAK